MARAQAKRKESKPQRSRLPLLLIVVAAAGLLLGTAWQLRDQIAPESLPIRAVQVRSELQHVSAQALREAVAEEAKRGFLAVNVEAIRQDIEQLPWVDKASVRRAWPDKLVIEVIEQQPVARWAGGGLINERGERFTPKQTPQGLELPLLEGPQGSSESVAQQYVELRRLVSPLGVGLNKVTMSERGAWQLKLDNGLHLRLGRQSVVAHMLRFVRVYADAIAPQLDEIEVVDLRYTNGFAVRWRPGSGPATV